MTNQEARRLSVRAVTLLTLIRDYTDKDWATGQTRSYWLPSSNRNGQWSETLNQSIGVSGSGDARCLRSLAAKGLIKRPRGCTLGTFAYEITEDGLLAIEAAVTGPYYTHRNS